MLIPAMFVASAVRSNCANKDTSDVIVFTAPGEADREQRTWLASHGVGLVEDLDLSPLHDLPTPIKRLTAATFMRLLVPQYLDGRYDAVLYLDCDLTIHGDVGRILALDTGRSPVAATPAARVWAGWTAPLRDKDHAQFRALGMTEPYRFFNTGVLLIDVGKWNRAELGRRTLQFYRQNSALCPLPDEHALNAVLDGDMAEISPVWNMRIKAWSHPAVRDHIRPAIVHYDGPLKPWQRSDDGAPLFPEAHRSYESFVAGTAWEGWPSDKRTTSPPGLADDFREATVEARDSYAAAFLEFCAAARFADVDQGIVRRDGGCLRLS
jgi:hypothetical protein